MKILLLGDYSSLYWNLKQGLEELGHQVSLASYGDGWKEIPRDIDFGSGVDMYSIIKRKLIPNFMLDRLTGYDVVQFINPFYFYHRLFSNKWLLERIIGGNGKFFLSAAGDDAFFWRYGREKLRYGPFDDFLKYDIKKSNFFMESNKSYEFNQWVVDKCDGVIPIMYEYDISYRGCKKKLAPIPIPINTKEIVHSENVIGKKLIVFHGLNRYGFKGTRHVEEAFSNLKKKYPSDLEVVIKGKMPLNEYINLMQATNVVVDQVNSYSLGVNGVYALAMGKVVVGGAEPESLDCLEQYDSPVLNVLPNADHLKNCIEYLLDRKLSIPKIGEQSRRFAEQNHCHVKIATKYLEAWS